MSQQKIAVSVVIPLYNAEKYIGACLYSLLAQTFKDFEVIVVDDCSTDNGSAIVESYASKFDGRLKIIRMEKKSGGAGVPRNKGLSLAEGEYVYFSDADDMLTSTALEEMYTAAEKFSADVVYCEKNFESDACGKNIRVVSHQDGVLVDKPTLQDADLRARVQDLLQRDIWGAPWLKLVSRNFLLKNELYFPDLCPCEDYLWTLTLFFSAEKFLRLPNVTYLYRKLENSSSRFKRTPSENVAFWLNPVIFGLKWLNNRLVKIDFFKDNFQIRYAVLEFVVKKMLGIEYHIGVTVEPHDLYAALKRQFGKNLGEYDVLVSVLLAAFHAQQKLLLLNQHQLKQFAAQTQWKIAELEQENRRLKERVLCQTTQEQLASENPMPTLPRFAANLGGHPAL